VLRHPKLANAIIALRPGSRALIDFIVEDHGDGPTLLEGSMVNPPTQAEVDALTPQQFTDAQSDKRINGMDELQMRIMFNHENRVRVLESKAPITLAQFKTALRQFA
jgi:hypothetical protein